MNEILLQLYECPCSDARGRPLLLLAMLVIAAATAAWIAKRPKEKGGATMSAVWKVVIVVLLAMAVAVVFALKQSRQPKTQTPSAAAIPAVAGTSGSPPTGSMDTSDESKPLPRLLDVGAGTCIPCKMMMPVLAELKTQYASRLRVEYCDIRDEPNAVQKYKVMVIPTQILYDASGKELFRHEGFFAKDDILAKWKELGIDLSGPASQTEPQDRSATRTNPGGQ